MKKILYIALAGIIAASIIGFMLFKKNDKGTTEKKNIRIGVSLYRFNDTFRSSIKKVMENYV